MFSFTAQHILVMRLITQLEIDSPALLHNFLFLATAESLDYHDIGFYDFIRSKNGAYSPVLYSILQELVIGQLLTKDPLKLTTKGSDTYYALASSLNPFEDYLERCFNVYMRHKDCLDAVNKAINSHILFHKAQQGKRIFPNNIEVK